MTFDLCQYEALTAGIGYVNVSDWTKIEVAGADRLKFLNNFCTADLLRLTPNTGAEAFICNVKGKVLGHVLVDCGDDVALVETVPGQASKLVAHLDRYILRDDVTLRDATGKYGLIVVGGDRAEGVLQSLINADLPTGHLALVECQLAGVRCAVARGTMLGPKLFSLRVALEGLPQIIERLRNAGTVECSRETIDTYRVEAGMPLYERDITDDNLPQEVNRNAEAISFTKGCYLGQETVARIDALGHVNRLLVGVQFFGERVPAASDELDVAGKPVGHVTSATFSPRLSKPLALAYLRTAHAQPGSRLTAAAGGAEVIAMPVS